ncbi:hypothetical protein E4K66_18135 [Bradyrhizobium frederickii]|uniref:Uncharacterized protein n=1 Tax=Bradyrhizobium frederickii TaxID=2560054 RepID=A0A4Y9L401_9BRAD|nr:hypothetical protein [Bradyrhizobium frederickii]TFV38298.1 hypothetical protein E4K66_18135 [Bradyrhizobium frederickii]
MMTTKGIPHYKTYAQRFGSLAAAFRRVGFEPKPRYCFQETAAKAGRLISSVVEDIVTEIERRHISISFLHELRLLTISSTVTASVTLARVVSDGEQYPGPKPRWEIQRLKYRRSDLVLIIRLDDQNAAVKDYFLLPMASLPKTRDGRLRISNRVFGPFRCDTFADLISDLLRRLGRPRTGAEDKQSGRQVGRVRG